MKKLLIVTITFLMLCLAVSAVSASDNATDVADLNQAASDGDVLKTDQANNEVNVDESTKVTSQITSQDATGYHSISKTVKATLTANGDPLVSKTVTIVVNGEKYTKTTNEKGEVAVALKLAKGTYKIKYSFAGDSEATSASTTSTLTIKPLAKTKLVVGDKFINYRQGCKSLFYVRLLDSSNKAVAGQTVTFKVNKKTYAAKTNKNGNACIRLNLKKGTYEVKFSFSKNAPYAASSGSFIIKVRAPMGKGNGYWLWPMHMKSINLKSVASKGTKHLFLHSDAISAYGKGYVVSFIKKANKYGIKVHIWMQVFCDSNENWISPVNDDGSFKLAFMAKKIKEAVRYAKIQGVEGIHFDYVRYGGTAHKHINAVKSITYFVKKASTAVHNAKHNCIVSAAVMPEPSMMEYYYGQDIKAMSKYLDVILPMVYKGNYNQNRAWIKSVTKTFVEQSKGAQIWTGLQSYRSDSDTTVLSQSELLKDATVAKAGGAKGVIMFRFGLCRNFNFAKVF
ncbi:MAG: hypothetical protein IKF11_01645 [Methanobrevibacter sp.]|nr:hypothetical protein [Methanobrevibacter sp.]